MSLHFPLPKNRTFRFSLHTSSLSLHGEVTILALKFAMSSHFPLPKKNFALFVPGPLFQMARAARRVIENPRQMIKSQLMIEHFRSLSLCKFAKFWHAPCTIVSAVFVSFGTHHRTVFVPVDHVRQVNAGKAA